MKSTSPIPTKVKFTLADVRRAKFKKSFFEFVQYFWDTIIAEKPVWNWHIKYLCDELQAIGEKVARREEKDFDYCLINVPPGSSKSTIVSEMYPIWCWTIDPTQRFICGSFASTPAEDIAEKCYNIYTSEKFKELYPELVAKTSGGKTHFKNGLLGERYTTSTGSGITGIHAHQKIIDDPMSPQIAESEAERERANKWVSETLGRRNVSEEVTVTIIVMQRLHEQDTTGYLLSKKGLRIKHICIPAELSDDVQPVQLRQYYVDDLFDPLRKSWNALAAAKAELGGYGYAGQMQQRPTPAGGLIWQKWFIEVDDILFPDPAKAVDLGSDWDLAYTSDEKNAASAYVTSGKVDNKIYLFDFHWQWLEFPQLIHWMKTVAGPHYIEAKASGKSAKQTLTQNGVVAIEIEVKGGADKIARARSATPTAEAGMVYIKKSMADRLYNDAKQGILFFPKGQYKDLADALAQALQRHSVKGFRMLGSNDRTDPDYDPLDDLGY